VRSVPKATSRNIEGTALKVGGAVVDYRCILDTERDEYALEVYTQIT
jgi:hypothetical protein